VTPSGSSAQSKRAIVLLSGGLDSATVLAMAGARGFECYALSVHYGQRHSAELEAARRIAALLGARDHRVMGVDLAGIGGSALFMYLIQAATGGQLIPGFDPPKLVPWSAALALISLSLCGIFAGLYPASKAAALEPVEALRRE